MSIRRRTKMAVSDSELSAMTGQLEDTHASSFTANLSAITKASASRRTFLLGTGGVLALGALAACGDDDDDDSSSSPSSSSAPSGSGTYTGDFQVVALAAALENLAVTAYDGALMKASSGGLGEVPPAVATFVTTAKAQHQQYADAWNGVLTGAGLPAIEDAPLTITADAVAGLQAATTVGEVAKLALGLEETAAQTYLFAQANVTDAGGIMTAAAIGPVIQQRAAILHFVLGEYPVPATFLGIDKAVPASALTV